MIKCPECGGALRARPDDDLLISLSQTDSYYCPDCKWSSDDMGDVEELDEEETEFIDYDDYDD